MSRGTSRGGLGDYPAAPLLLERSPKKHNIIIGNDPMQVRWAEQFLSVAHDIKIHHEIVPIVTDDMVHSEEPKLYVVERSSFIDLAPAVKQRTGIWVTDLIDNKSAGLNVIVRQGAKLLGIEKPEKDKVAILAKKMDDVHDVRAALWHAAWLWTGPISTSKGWWLQPWENWLTWMPKDEDPKKRLHSLYWDLVRWVFASTGDEQGYRKTRGRWDQAAWKKLSLLKLPKDKVYNTLIELSKWRKQYQDNDPWVSVIKISSFWCG